MQQPGIKDVKVVTTSKSSTRTIDTDDEQDSHVTANCIGSCPVLSVDQLKGKERGDGLPTGHIQRGFCQALESIP